MDISALSGGYQSSRLATRASSSAAGAADANGSSGADTTDSKAKKAPAGAEGLYISPVLKYDQTARLAVLYFRDFDTGETRDQIPTEKALERYRQSGGEEGSANSEAEAATSGNAASAAPTPGIGASFLDGPPPPPAASSSDGGQAAAPPPPPTSGGGPQGSGAGVSFSVTV